MNSVVIGQQMVNALALGSVYAMIAVGLAMIYGVLRILHIAHAGIFVAGAYLGLYFFKISNNFAFALVASMLLTGLLGSLIERFIYRPMLPKPRIVALIASIGIFICLADFFRLVAGPFQLAFDYPALGGRFMLAGMAIPRVNFAIIGGTLLLFLLLWFILRKTRIGFGIRAVAQDRDTAQMMGINVNLSVQVVFILSSMIAAFGAIMVSILYNSVYTTMGDMIGYKGLALIVIGGFGSIPGAIMAGLLLGILETFFVTYSDMPLSRDGIAMLMLVLVLLVRPQGLMGKGVGYAR
ncbi:branched-chain amino acid ABC transporter permease [Pusillimonas noertemannii]|uniref:branched-chain amino acid ABC transporter permease n=1 Tax=Pusillimonas noertemannii TaxID=305977 RepID=UPI0002EC2748|nr:branched-chain amino acid ABC transporter permease [Pusillimonas noertemannii]